MSSESNVSEPPYIAIARQKRLDRWAQIPPEWRIPRTSPYYSYVIPAAVEPTGDLIGDTEDAYNDEHGITSSQRNVMNVPRECGLLTAREMDITEGYSNCASLLTDIARGKTLGAEEVIRAFCKRAAIVQQLTNCLTEPLFKRAIQRAIFLDKHLRETGKVLGPLHGLPISIKDCFNIEGVDSSTGIASLCFSPATESAPLVQLLESIGAVILTKTNVPQTMAALDSVNNVFGRTINPLNSSCTAGGSSGGEGVIVAMKGSFVGIGTDIGGSIRIPAMCQGLIGLKPSSGRFPYGGQQEAGEAGFGDVGVKATAGPIARKVEDARLLFEEMARRSSQWGHDCIPWMLPLNDDLRGSGDRGELIIGVLRSDGNAEPLPPISRLLDEVVEKLRARDDYSRPFKVIELPTAPAVKEATSLLNKFLIIDGVGKTIDLIDKTKEPVIPWLRAHFRRREPKMVVEVEHLAARRAYLKQWMLNHTWYENKGLLNLADRSVGQRKRRVDAIICPVAGYPTPPVDRWAGIGYTSAWNLLDYAAGTLPVRKMREQDLDKGIPLHVKEKLSTQEKGTLALWHETFIDRSVYLNTPLSIQIVCPTLEESRLLQIMSVLDQTLHPHLEDKSLGTSKPPKVKGKL